MRELLSPEGMLAKVDLPAAVDKDGDGIADSDNPCPSSPNPLVFGDAFASDNGWQSYSGSWKVESGDFVQSLLQASISAQHLYRTGVDEADVYLELSTTRVQGASSICSLMGGAVRSQLHKGTFAYHFCGVNLTACSWAQLGLLAIARAPGTTQGTLYPRPLPVGGAGPYAIRILVVGQQFRCWLAGNPGQSVSWKAPSPASGTVELMTEAATARFHEIRVYRLPSPCS